MIFSLSLCLNYFNLNLILLTIFAFISSVVNDVQKCTIGLTNGCPPNQLCVQTNTSQPIGQCVCRTDCPSNSIPFIATVRPLPIYSNDNNSNNNSILISSIFVTIISLTVISLGYYFGVRKGLFRDMWRRTFTQTQFEHQLLDRNPRNDDNNDSEAIA